MKRALLITTALLTACREAPAPFSLENPFTDDTTGHLTFNVNPDHAPVWSETGDSLYYNAATYPGLPASNGMMLAVPRTGGTAAPILRAAQFGFPKQPWLAGLALSADAKTAAFLELTDVRTDEFDAISCPMAPPPAPQTDTLATNAFLVGGVLRVRKTNSTSGSDDARLNVSFEGRTYANNSLVNVIAYPFHRLFDVEGVPFFRPSWSPDGTKVVFSDGLRLRLWTIGQATSTVIPNTDDGILPAWSPDGTLIAFSKLLRGATQNIGCRGLLDGVSLPLANFSKRIYTPMNRENSELWVVRPDGTGARTLGQGDGPTWTTDSKTIVAHRNFNLYRIPVDNSAATAIPNTLDGFEPALSRDGKFLSFARRTTTTNEFIGNYDIWVARF